MKQKIALVVLLLVSLLATVFGCDDLVLRYRMAKGKQPFGTVVVYHYYAVEEKNHKTEYVGDQAETQTCVRSLFPHFGYSPCWYLKRHTEQPIEM